VTLRLAGGDRAAAIKMLEDPDALMAHPEVIKVIEGGEVPEGNEGRDWEDGAGEESWEAAAAEPSVLPPPPAMEEEEEEEEVGAQPPKPAAAAAKEAAVEEEEDEEVAEADPREHLSLVFIGHVDAGKSTLAGNLLYLTDFVDKRTVERYEREAKQRNRESWFLAFIMDTNEEERAKGKTVEVGRAHFETEQKRFTILDAPGHNAYVPNMISGTAQADVAVLVVSARKGEFETGFLRNGQTREHALLAQALGVTYMVVVVNKMDDHTVGWSQERYNEIVTQVRPFLKTCGFTIKTQVRFVPISGLTGANILTEVEQDVCPWWSQMVKEGANNTTEPTLLKLLSSLTMEEREPEASLRCPVLDRYSDRGTMVLAKVERGTLREGHNVVIMPTRQKTEVVSILVGEKRVTQAKTGENVVFKLSCQENEIMKGFVVCDESQPCQRSTLLKCQVWIIELPPARPIFTKGFESVFHSCTIEEECMVVDLLDTTTKKKGVIERRPRFAKDGAVVTAVIRLNRQICAETYSSFAQMGRFALRSEGSTIAIGKIVDIKNQD
jgi:peptide chain release factor subunit 3